ncbi:MAG TPA: hypothetical protein VLB69_01150 [Rudaea sp.]|nr:hypothetical protein [Rudaea sp.]
MSLPSSDRGTPHQLQRRRRGGVVWQPHYEGFTTIAYQSGKAIAGISGPWSDQYVLIWWDHSQPIRQVELFDTLEEAKQAVAQRLAPDAGSHLQGLLGALRRPAGKQKRSWLNRLRRALGLSPREQGQTRLVDHRRRGQAEETDLRGLNFRAIR